MEKFKELELEFNDRVKDIDSPFSGTVTGLCIYKSSNAQALVVSDLLDNDSKPVELWFPVDKLEKY